VSAPESKPLVLLIDDSVDVHRLLQARLRNEQIRLTCLTSGLEALRMCTTETPSCVLLDLDMPEIDGFEFLRRMKEEPRSHNVPVIVLSALHGSEDKVTAFDLGATDYVTKPFDLSELRARLRAALRLDHLLKLLAERADVDGLTGLGNRSHFNKRWAEKTAENTRYGHPLSLAILDIDFFKRINDTYGHPAGDEVLQGFARLLQCECRAPDIACRYGGEEFALIMPHTSPDDATKSVERIREVFAAQTWARHPDHRVTVSIGLTGCAGVSTLTSQEWVEAADRNLYAAKRGGRNKVVATDVTPTAPTLLKAA
jgi:two-component system, cell cycle response regulator